MVEFHLLLSPSQLLLHLAGLEAAAGYRRDAARAGAGPADAPRRFPRPPAVRGGIRAGGDSRSAGDTTSPGQHR